jgi:apolipoprotein N-acyltransferase
MEERKESAGAGSPIPGPFRLKCPKWLAAALLYGISWSGFTGFNLSFIAWFAFVPLFADLEERNTFRAFYSRSLLFSAVAYFIICHGFLVTAWTHPFIFIGAADELFLTSIPFALIYPFKKRFGFKTALAVLPFVLPLWEWLYQRFEHTTGYLMLSNSQCANTPLIQFIDILGVWSIGFWVTAFNVLLFLLYRKRASRSASRTAVILVVLAMTVPPLGYYAYKNSNPGHAAEKRIRITLIHTRFSLSESSPDRGVDRLERLAFLTDSIDYELKSKNLRSDLYVWHEGAIDSGRDPAIIAFLDTAVNDWRTPLLSGMKTLPENAPEGDLRSVNRAALFEADARGHNPSQTYDKIRLFPIRETIPYRSLLSKIPFFTRPLDDPALTRPGDGIRLIEIANGQGERIRIGTPICQEQNYPYLWSGMAAEGADCFVQLSFESWWTLEYFKRQMAGITRLRCIETGRGAARCSNAGVTTFIDGMGRILSPAAQKEGAITADLPIRAGGTTFFTRHQNLFPLFCLAMTVLIAAVPALRRRLPVR